jgi:beta-galactosidase
MYLLMKKGNEKMNVFGNKKSRLNGLRCGLVMLGASLLGSSLQAAENMTGDALRETISMDRQWSFQTGALTLPGRTLVSGWHYRMEPAGEAAAFKAAELTSSLGVDLGKSGWKKGTRFSFAEDISGREWELGGNLLQAGDEIYAWFRTELPGKAALKPTLEIEQLNGRAWVYLNGQQVGAHKQRSRSRHCLVDLSPAWQESGTNVLAILVKAKGNGGLESSAQYVDQGSVVVPASSVISPEYDDSGWRRVDVPHDYVVEGPIRNRGADGYLRETAWYRKTFTAPEGAEGSRIWLEFDGVYRMSRYWLNGKPIGEHPSGYSLCRLDITDHVRSGNNTLVVSVDPRLAEGWWYNGGGIYRHVRMVVVPEVHVAADGVFVRSTIPDPKDGITAPATIHVDTTVANTTKKAAKLEVRHAIVAADGSLAQTSHKTMKLAPGEDCVKQTFKLADARLWSCERPELYTLRTTIALNGKPVDEVETTFGVRKAEFDKDRGFLLNGKVVKLKGTANHENHAGVGVGIPDRLHVWRLEQLKKMGFNAYRCGAHQANPVVYDACDRLGILALGEFRIFGDGYDMKASRDTGAEELSDQRIQLKHTRNHPCIIVWSLGNEEGAVESNEDGARIASAIKKVVHELDGTRLTTMATHGGPREGVLGVVDVLGMNYGRPDKWDKYHRQYPEKPYLATEACSEVSTRGFYERNPFVPTIWRNQKRTMYGDNKRGYVSSYSENGPNWWISIEDNWKAVQERPWVSGTFIWTGFDYKGEPLPFKQPSQPAVASSFGILDSCGFPKDSYYYYKSWWGDEPVVHVFPHWNWAGKEGQKIPVWVHSNADEVELFLNGKSLGKKKMERNSHLEWDVPYAPGKLEAKGFFGDKEISDVVETTGKPVGLVIDPDRALLAADGKDLAWVAVKVTDSEGRVVPSAMNKIRFSVTGPGKVIGVGNGDSSSHEPDKASARSAFHGLCMVLVQTKQEWAGRIVLTAESDGLTSASVTLKSAELLENTEWADIRHWNANRANLPRVLLVGDSIAGEYKRQVMKRLNGIAEVSWYTTGRWAGDPEFEQELDVILDQFDYDAVYFNNGLQGAQYSLKQYEDALTSIFNKLADQDVAVAWCDSTMPNPNVGDVAGRDRIKRRNEIARALAKKQGFKTDNLGTFQSSQYQGRVNFTAGVAAGQAAHVAKTVQKIIEAKSQDAGGSSVREGVEWSFIRHKNANQVTLPRVLLVGDSIVGGYCHQVSKLLEGTANVSWYMTSRCMGNPEFDRELDRVLAQRDFDVIYFNNGLHGARVSSEQYEKGMVCSFEKLAAEGAVVVWRDSTLINPDHKDDAGRAQISDRNAIAHAVAQKFGFQTDNLGAFEASAYQDKLHYIAEAQATQAAQVAKVVQKILENK